MDAQQKSIPVEQLPAKYRRLDKSKPFGEYCPSIGAAKYEQNGLPYTHDGTLVSEQIPVEAWKGIELEMKREAARKVAEAAYAKAMAEAGLDAGEMSLSPGAVEDIHVLQIGRGAPKPPAPPTPEDIAHTKTKLEEEMIAWATSKVDMPFDRVQGLIKSAYSKHVTNAADAVDFIGEKFKIPVQSMRDVPR